MKKDWLCIATLFLAFFLIGSDTFIVSPLIPAMIRDLHISPGAGGSFVASYSLSYVALTFLLGPLSDRIGRKKMMGIGLLLFAGASFLTGAANNLVWILLARGLTGTGAAFLAPNIWAFIGDHFTGNRRAKVTSVVASALSLGLVLGVPLGTVIEQQMNWRVCFAVIGVYAAGLAILLFLTLPQGAAHLSAPKKEGGNLYREVFCNRQAVLSFAISFLLNFATFGCYTFLGYWLQHVLHQPASVSGTVFLLAGIGNFIGIFLSGALSGKGRPEKLAFVFSLPLTAALCLLPFSAAAFPAAVLDVMVLMAAGGGVFSPMQVFVTQLSDRARGTVVAVNNGFFWSGTAIGSMVLGVVLDNSGFSFVMLLCAISAGAACVLLKCVARPQKS